MALSTMRKKFEAAKKDHQDALKKLGTGFQKEIVDTLSKLLPEGWMLHWQHSDQQYNDEDYYWDIGYAYLVTERKPRQGKLLKEATETRTEEVEVPYRYGGGGTRTERRTVYGTEAEYEWILDEKCKPRGKKTSRGEYYEDPGAVNIERGEDNDDLKFGLKRSDFEELDDVFRSLTQDDLTLAFGAEAVVTVHRDGICEVD